MTWTSKVFDSVSAGARPNTYTGVLTDQEWLDAVNQERKAQQLDKISYETFEIIMDRLEKEWFDLVSPHERISHNSPVCDAARSPRTFPSPTWVYHPRIQLVQYATTPKERIPMPSYSVMAAISPCIKV